MNLTEVTKGLTIHRYYRCYLSIWMVRSIIINYYYYKVFWEKIKTYERQKKIDVCWFTSTWSLCIQGVPKLGAIFYTSKHVSKKPILRVLDAPKGGCLKMDFYWYLRNSELIFERQIKWFNMHFKFLFKCDSYFSVN